MKGSSKFGFRMIGVDTRACFRVLKACSTEGVHMICSGLVFFVNSVSGSAKVAVVSKKMSVVSS